jgi:hypothetical protein
MFSNIRNKVIANITDLRAPLGGALGKEGGALKFSLNPRAADSTLELSERLSLDPITFPMHNFLRGNKNKGFFFHDVALYHPEICYVIDKNLTGIAEEYLGKLRLDSVSLFAIYNDVELEGNSSGLWHHDSVGHRLKIFVPLNKTGNKSAPTEYFVGSNTLKYSKLANGLGSDGRRIDPSALGLCDSNIRTIECGFTEGFVFDTNGLHRGVYNNSIETRLNLVFEFSNPLKSYMRGYVGQCPMVLMEAEIKHLHRLGLTDIYKWKKINSNTFSLPGRKLLKNEIAKIANYINY